MVKIENLSYISELIDTYGNLLTKKQLKYIDLYYFNDYSLIEISKEYNVSKNAIYDSITKSIDNLKNIDSKLNLINKKNIRLKLYKKIENDSLRKKLEELE